MQEHMKPTLRACIQNPEEGSQQEVHNHYVVTSEEKDETLAWALRQYDSAHINFTTATPEEVSS